ncbi:hypothetical protein RchiOBHm_Chr7g0217491 [Rosa chinensis]|uniref:Uncharacterized protein n=1 Tax=Rosa chinensis TaxID=74649 RepID=A0A2P6PC05_ROSCH|nr:hypothetical protein RchiOBHm_Chr7g0217491 [Rosa chinensis]
MILMKAYDLSTASVLVSFDISGLCTSKRLQADANLLEPISFLKVTIFALGVRFAAKDLKVLRKRFIYGDIHMVIDILSTVKKKKVMGQVVG